MKRNPDYWPEDATAAGALAMLLIPQMLLLVAAILAGRWTGIEPLEQVVFTPLAILTGLTAGLFLLGAIHASRLMLPNVWAELDDRAIRLFAEAPFRLDWPMIVGLSLVAGFFEEIVFRGALQGWLVMQMPAAAAIGLQALLFALLHPVSRAYMVYVLLIGVAFGIFYQETGNLAGPIIAHALFDIVALARLRRLAALRRS